MSAVQCSEARQIRAALALEQAARELADLTLAAVLKRRGNLRAIAATAGVSHETVRRRTYPVLGLRS